MDCPTCGYAMTAFDAECPRCTRLKAQGRDPAAIYGQKQMPAPMPAPSQVKQPYAPPQAQSPYAQPQAQQPYAPQAPTYQPARPQRERYSTEPELGYPLVILLWVAIVINAVFVGIILLAAVGLQAMANDADTTHTVGALMLLVIAIPAIRLISCIGMLRQQRWGFFVFTIFTVLPVGISLMMGGVRNPVQLAVDVIPALLIFVLALMKWDVFE